MRLHLPQMEDPDPAQFGNQLVCDFVVVFQLLLLGAPWFGSMKLVVYF